MFYGSHASFIDFKQQAEINSASRDANAARGKAERLETQVSRLEKQCDALALACQAMWELLKNSSNLTEEHIQDKILEIDLRDGKADGKMTASPIQCKKCSRRTSPNRDTCLYCGEIISKEGSPFQ